MPQPAKNGATAPPTLDLERVLFQEEPERTEMDKVLEIIFDPKNIGHLTELSRNEITAFSVLSTMAQRYNLPVLRQWLEMELLLRVSRGRAGRKELVRLVSRSINQEAMMDGMQPAPGGFRRWLGRRGPGR